jgi:hypothetical protein
VQVTPAWQLVIAYEIACHDVAARREFVQCFFSFDPHVSRTVRLVMTAGLGYQEIWGNHTYSGGAWERSGCEVMTDLGVAIQLAPKFELLASIGGSVMPAGSAPWFFDLAAALGLGLRYTP